MIKKTYNRILEISDDHKQITLPDSRYYRRNGEYYPSVTYVLQSYPKGKHFEDWLKKVGYSADWIVKKAGEEGNALTVETGVSANLGAKYTMGQLSIGYTELIAPMIKAMQELAAENAQLKARLDAAGL